jgi:hypothetical protein
MSDISAERLVEVRAALQQIVAAPDRGQAALSNPGLMSNLLKDLLPDAPLEKTVLVAASENRLAETIGNLIAQHMPADAAIRMSADSLAANTGMTIESCVWASAEIAAALGLMPRQDSPPAWSPPPGPAFGAPPRLGQEDITVVPPGRQPGPGYGVQSPEQAGFGLGQPGSGFGSPGQQPGPGYGVQSPEQAGFGLGQPGSGFGSPGQQPGPAYGQPAQQPGAGFGTPGQQAGFGYGPPPVQQNYRPPRSGRSVKIWAAAVTAVVAVIALILVFVLQPSPNPHPRPVAATPSVHVYHFSDGGPIALALAGSAAWIAEASPDRLVELNTSDGSHVRSNSTDLDFPWDIAVGGGNVWAANDRHNPGSVTKLDMATGAVTKITGSFNGIANPTAVAVQGDHVWVANLGTQTKTGFTGFGSVTELDASSGTVVKTFPGSKSGITYPDSIAISGPYVWVVDGGYHGGLGGVTRIDSRTGNTLTLTGANYGFERPAAIAIGGGHVWVLNDPYRGRLSVTEMNASDGSLVKVLNDPAYDFGSYVSYLQYRAQGIAAAGNRVWVVDPVGGEGHGAVTEINAQTGGLVRVLSGQPYNFYQANAVAAAGSQVWISSFGPKNAPGWVTVLQSFK